MPYVLPKLLTREGWITRRTTIKAPPAAEKLLLEHFKWLAETAATVDLDAVEKARVRLSGVTADDTISQIEREVKQEVEADGMRLKMRIEKFIPVVLEFTRSWAARGTANEETAKHFLTMLALARSLKDSLDNKLRDLKGELALRVNRRRIAITRAKTLTLADIPANPKLLALCQKMAASYGASENLAYYLAAYKTVVPPTVGEAKRRFDTYLEKLNISLASRHIQYHAALTASGASDNVPVSDALATPGAQKVTRKDGAAATQEFQAMWERSFAEIAALTRSGVLLRVAALDEAIDLFDT